MKDLHAVLLVPLDADPHRLIREGPCGAKAPIVYEIRHEGPVEVPEPVPPYETYTGCKCGMGWPCKKQGTVEWLDQPTGAHQRQALALEWKDELVEEGIDRLVRRLRGLEEKTTPFVFLKHGLPNHVVIGKCAEQAGLGTLLCLDAKGKEMRL